MEKTINICREAAQISNEYEKNNTGLKKEYIIRNIMLYNSMAEMVSGYKGSFGTGYPFYVLNKGFKGDLPVIDEQLRYNEELIKAVENSKYTTWTCAECLSKNGTTMPDLKQICKTCPNMDNALKPRKVINRLPDIDMWMVCEDSYVQEVMEKLINLFNENNMQPSDINPLQTIMDIKEITECLKNGIMPEKMLPADAHIINYSTLHSLIEQVPFTIKHSLEEGNIPYLPIHPLSYRKKWQYDDAAYNFIHDFLSSLTEFSFEGDLQQLLDETRNIVASEYSFEQLYNILLTTGPESVERRHKTLQLKTAFKGRIDSWKK